MDGDNNLWKFNDTFTVPVEKVNFPAAPGDVAYNEVSIIIDAGNKDVILSSGQQGCQVWATSVDWIGIKFDAAQPVYLMTGLFGSPAALENSGYVDNLLETAGLYSKIIDHGFASAGLSCDPLTLDAISADADSYIEQLIEDGEKIGTAEVHLVGHSMGGLDGRMLLKKLAEQERPVKVTEMDGQPVYEAIKVDSLLTHSAPHEGTLVADYLLATIPASGFFQDLCELTVETWKVANPALNQLNGAKVATIGADADRDGSGSLDSGELAGNQIPWQGLGNKFYKLLYNHDELTVDYQVVMTQGGAVSIPIIEYSGNGPNPNDAFVTLESAHGVPGVLQSLSFTGSSGKNHGTIIDTETQNSAIALGVGALGWGDLQ